MNNLHHECIEVNESLKLEQLMVNDAESLYALTDKNREYISQFLPWPKHTKSVDDSRRYIESKLQQRADMEEFGYGIKYDGVIAGHMSLMHLNDDKSPEIGYWVGKEFSGKGITTRATIALTRYALHELDITSIIVRAVPNNIGSNKVAEKAGYLPAGQQEEDGKIYNIWEYEK